MDMLAFGASIAFELQDFETMHIHGVSKYYLSASQDTNIFKRTQTFKAFSIAREMTFVEALSRKYKKEHEEEILEI